MKIFLIEDEQPKSKRIISFLTSKIEGVDISLAESLQQAIKTLNDQRPDVILLDMSLPVFTYSLKEQGFQHNSYAGKDILEHLDNFDIKIPVIIVTAFTQFGSSSDALTLEELDKQCKEEYPDQYIGCVWYSSIEDNWQEILLDLLTKIKR